jgi:hypothetical protein
VSLKSKLKKPVHWNLAINNMSGLPGSKRPHQPMTRRQFLQSSSSIKPTLSNMAEYRQNKLPWRYPCILTAVDMRTLSNSLLPVRIQSGDG